MKGAIKMKKMIYGIVGNSTERINGIRIDKYVDSSKIGSLIDLAEPNEIDIIVTSIRELGSTLNEITGTLNMIHDKGIGFKSLEEKVDSYNEQAFDSFISHINAFNNIALEQAQAREKQIRIGGKKRGKRESFQFPNDWEKIYKEMLMGNITKTQMTEHYGVSRQTIYVWLDRWEKVKQKQK